MCVSVTECLCLSVCVCVRGESQYDDEYDFVKVGEIAAHPLFFASMISSVTVCVSRRDMLLRVLSRSQLVAVVCYKAKDLLCTALQFYKQDLNWKQGILTHAYTHRKIHRCTSVVKFDQVVKMNRKQESNTPIDTCISTLYVFLYMFSSLSSCRVSYPGPSGVRVATGSRRSLF